MLSNEDSSLEALLESASSVITACQHLKKGTRHKKKSNKSCKKILSLPINHLDWISDEEDKDICNIENVPPVRQGISKQHMLKPLHKMISFSSDSDSSPVKGQSIPHLSQRTFREKTVFDQKHHHLLDGRTILEVCQTDTHSGHNTQIFTDHDTQTVTKVAKGYGAKLKSKISNTKKNGWDEIEDSKCKESKVKKDKLQAAMAVRKHKTELHALFDYSGSSSESDVASAPAPHVVRNVMPDSDSDDFIHLSRQLEQILSLPASRKKQSSIIRENAIPRQINALLAANSGLESVHDQHPMSAKQSNVDENATKFSSEMLDSVGSQHPVSIHGTSSPVGMHAATDGSSERADSMLDEILSEMKETSLQVSLSSVSGASPEASIGEVSKTLSIQNGSTRRQRNCASYGEPVCCEGVMEVSAVAAHTDTSQHFSLHVEDNPRTDNTEVDLIAPCTRDFSLQVSLSSTELSESDSSESGEGLHGPTHCSRHLPTAGNCSVLVSSSSATDGSHMSSDGLENEQVDTIDDSINSGGLSLGSSENSSSCQGHMTQNHMTSGSDAKLNKKLFPGWTAGSLSKRRDVSSSRIWDSGIGDSSGKHADRKQAAKKPEGASFIDLCVDETGQQERSLSPEEGCDVTHVGLVEVDEDDDPGDDWLPDLDSSSDEDDLEAFFQAMKTREVKKPIKDLPSLDEFIVNDSDVSSDDSALYVTANDRMPTTCRKPSVPNSVFVTPTLPSVRRKAKTTAKKAVLSNHTNLDTDFVTLTSSTPLDRPELIKRPHSTAHQLCSEASFLRSLDQQMDNSRRHPEAARYVNHFKKLKEELTAYLFQLYNKTVFAHKLPEDMSITWNKRLNKTAGFCAYSKKVMTPADRKVRIELSVKVCDAAERVRDTLIHELCHAAVWLLNGVNAGHGPHWKYWAQTACRAHPALPAIKRCHKYEISHKYTYKCTKCGYEIGRHSKSLNTKAKVCGYCQSPFKLITKTAAMPRTPNKFALFVKDNYGSVKRDNKSITHKDVMRILSSDFARQNSISLSGGQYEL